MPNFEAKRYKFNVFKNELKMGIPPFNSRGEAYAFIEEDVLRNFPELNIFMMYVALSRRNRKNHTKIAVTDKENVKLITYDVVTETIRIRLTDAIGDFQLEDENESDK